MTFRLGKAKPRDQEPEEERWSTVLEQVHEEHQDKGPWWQRIGIFFAWAGGFAGAATVAAALLLLIVDLFSAGRLFTVRTLSDWMFWVAAFLMFGGLLAPSATELEKATSKREKSKNDGESRLTRSVRKRIRRVYNPWRWRLWASAVLAFGLSVLAGLFAQKPPP
jgi:hypothetical protein